MSKKTIENIIDFIEDAISGGHSDFGAMIILKHWQSYSGGRLLEAIAKIIIKSNVNKVKLFSYLEHYNRGFGGCLMEDFIRDCLQPSIKKWLFKDDNFDNSNVWDMVKNKEFTTEIKNYFLNLKEV